MESSHFGQVRHFGFFLPVVHEDAESNTAATKKIKAPIRNFIETDFILTNIFRNLYRSNMIDTPTHIILLILSIIVWLYGSFPLLRYTIEMSEGKFNVWLILWLVIMITAIFFCKHALLSLSGWPEAGSWSSRLFFGGMLFLSIPIPFIWEYTKQLFRKRK